MEVSSASSAPRLAACLLSASSGRALQAASSASAPSSLCVLCRRARSAYSRAASINWWLHHVPDCTCTGTATISNVQQPGSLPIPIPSYGLSGDVVDDTCASCQPTAIRESCKANLVASPACVCACCATPPQRFN